MATWVITIIIGISVGALAFCIESAVDHITRARLHALAWAIARVEEKRKTASVESEFHLLDLAPASLMVTIIGMHLALLASFLVLHIAPAAAGAGVALVMANLNGIHIPKLLAEETIIVKIIGTVCSVASGLPVGPEGPLVHIGAGVASFCTRQQRIRIGDHTVFSTHGHRWLDTFHNDGDRRDFLSAGVASGLAAAFGAPIGGVLFSLEEASTFWSHNTTWRSLLCSTLSVLTLSLLHSFTSAGPFAIGSPGLISFGAGGANAKFFVWELPIYATLAATAGAIGAVITCASKRMASCRPKTPVFRIAEAVVVTALCIIFALVTSHLFGSCHPVPSQDTSGVEAKEDEWGTSVAVRFTCAEGMFNDLATLLLGLRDDVIAELLSMGRSVDKGVDAAFPFSPGSVFTALIITLVTLVLACDLSLPAGMFMPTILWGGLLGSLFGCMAHGLAAVMHKAEVNTVAPGTYALVGATAALAGVFHSSISLVVIMLEGTGHIGFLVPLLVGVTVANLVGKLINGDSFYEEQLKAKGVPFLHHHDTVAPREAEPDASVTVETCMSTNLVSLRPQETVGRIEWVLRNTKHNGFPVVKPLRYSKSSASATPVDITATNSTSDVAEISTEDAEVLTSGMAEASDGGHLVGIILRSQLMVLLARRAFIELVAPPSDVPLHFPPFGLDPVFDGDVHFEKGLSGEGLFLSPSGEPHGVSNCTTVQNRLKCMAQGVAGFFQRMTSRTNKLVGKGLGIKPPNESNLYDTVSRSSSLHSLLPDDAADAEMVPLCRRNTAPDGAFANTLDNMSPILDEYFGDRDLSNEKRALEAYYDALDTDMRTFHHRHSFHDRSVSVCDEAVVRLGLTLTERKMHCDLSAFMKIAPLSVQSQCSAWRALGYFRSAGLRHLPVVDDTNVVVGMLTRADLIPRIRTTTSAAMATDDDGSDEAKAHTIRRDTNNELFRTVCL